jgi:hypothetical protein
MDPNPRQVQQEILDAIDQGFAQVQSGIIVDASMRQIAKQDI